MSDTRRKDVNWTIALPDGTATWERAAIAVLMDIAAGPHRAGAVMSSRAWGFG